jgi:hydrogenase maturation protease
VALRIIGCGNRDRGDDAAGLLVALRLHALGVETIEQSGDGISLMDCWAGFDHVILVDAVSPHGMPGRLWIWDACADRLPEYVVLYSSHAFGIRQAVELARALDRLPQTMKIYGIEGKQFSFGASLSPEVEPVIESVAQQLFEVASKMTLPRTNV